MAQAAADLDISEQTIYVWRRQHLIDTGQLLGRCRLRPVTDPANTKEATIPALSA